MTAFKILKKVTGSIAKTVGTLTRPFRAISEWLEEEKRKIDLEFFQFEEWMKARKSSSPHAPDWAITIVVRQVRSKAADHVKIDHSTTIDFLHEEIRYDVVRLIDHLEDKYSIEINAYLAQSSVVETLEDLALMIVYCQEVRFADSKKSTASSVEKRLQPPLP